MHPKDTDDLADCVVWPQGFKTFSMLNSAEHEILNAHKYKGNIINL